MQQLLSIQLFSMAGESPVDIPTKSPTISSIIMDSPVILILSFCVCLCFLKLYFSSYGNGKTSKVPPGPKPLPVFGNIFQLTDKTHQGLAHLSKTYGPLMFLKLGTVKTLVVSSADMAREVFLNHDLEFSSRKVPDSSRALKHDIHSMVFMPVSPQWRNLRKILAIHMFSKRRLDVSESLRLKKVSELLEYVGKFSENNQALDIGQVAFTTLLNLMSNTFFSVDMAAYGSTSCQEFRLTVCQLVERVAKPNMADFFPLLSYFDPQGVRRDVATSLSKLLAIFDDMISRRLSVDSSASCGMDDLLEKLLEINKEGSSGLGLDEIRHLLLDLFAAGTDTSSSTLEWAMAELLRNPSKMVKAQAELNEVIGKERKVQESNTEELPYLQAIVKETLRLHPPVPLLLPHKAREDVELCNYVVQKDTQVLVNVWAIGRDPDSWKNPTEFLPERFLEREIGTIGQDFELIPFGAGRRICPGMPLAYRMMHLMLASLLHAFNWKLANGISKEDVDMTERFGMALHMEKHLLAVPLPK